jgi:small GTP-binding protein
MRNVLTPALEEQLREARQLLGELRDALSRHGATDDDRASMKASIDQLDELFLLVVVGEFNAGKSAFINALVGTTVLEEGVTPTTAQLHVLRHGDAPGVTAEADGSRVITTPVEWLRDLHIVDTPGTNAIIREHERLTADFVPRADLVLFVTSADRPFTESERAFLETIRDWGKKIVIVINKVDIFADERELQQVVDFVRDAAARLLSITPEVFPVSARLAMRAKRGDSGVWAASRFERLETFIQNTLDDETRFRLKLTNPLGVGQALATRYASIAQQRLDLLREDVVLLQDIEHQLGVYREDLQRGFELRMGSVENVLLEMEARGHTFFDDTLRIGRVFDLLNRARIQKEFEDQVVADAPRQIETRVMELIDWLVDQDFRQWTAITARLDRRRQTHADRILGAPDVGGFHAERSRLIDSVGKEVSRVVDSYDRRREAEAIASQARTAVTAAAATGGAAVGLGTIISIAASTAAADATGIVMASLVATLGLFIIPARRRRARNEMREKLTALREKLATALRTEFTRATEASATRIARTVDPYSRFVRAESGRWEEARTSLERLRDRARSLIARLGPSLSPARGAGGESVSADASGVHE